MQVFIQKTNTSVEHESNGSVRELLISLSINPEFVIVAKDGVLVTLDDSVEGAERIDILSVVSGG